MKKVVTLIDYRNRKRSIQFYNIRNRFQAEFNSLSPDFIRSLSKVMPDNLIDQAAAEMLE